MACKEGAAKRGAHLVLIYIFFLISVIIAFIMPYLPEILVFHFPQHQVDISPTILQ